MRNILSSTLIVFTLIFASSARAQESVPTKESVLELIRLNDVGASLDIIKKDIESSTQASVQRAFAGETLSERQEIILAEMAAQAAEIFKEDLGAESLERDFVEI